MNISPSNIFPNILLLLSHRQSCQDIFGTIGMIRFQLQYMLSFIAPISDGKQNSFYRCRAISALTHSHSRVPLEISSATLVLLKITWE